MGKNKKNGWKAIGVLWSGLAVLLVMSLPAFGASPGMSGEAETESTDESTYTAVDGNRISKERLEDGIVEYEELGSLIHYGNLSIQEMTDSTERTRQEYQEIRDYLRAERASASAEKRRAKEDNDGESYREYASLEAVYSSAAKSYNERIKKLDRYAANKNRLSMEKQLTSAAQSLDLLLGADDTESLADIPPTDTNRLSEMNLEADIQKAIGNNGDLIAERAAKSAGTSSVNKKLRTLDELEEKVRIKMEQLYEEVNQKKQAYDAAKTGLDGAEILWSNIQNQYRMGMLSDAEYLEKQLPYMQKKMAFDSADLALFQALENYHWAVEGIVVFD